MSVDSGDLYLDQNAESPSLQKYDASTGALLTQFPSSPTYPAGLAVGHSTGEPELYVMNYREMDVFDAAGVLQNSWTGADTPSGAFGNNEISHGSVAVDESGSLSWAAGDVYVTDGYNRSGASVVDVFKPKAGGGEEYVTRIEGPEPPGVLFGEITVSVAVNQSNDEVLVVQSRNGGRASVDIFKPKPTELEGSMNSWGL